MIIDTHTHFYDPDRPEGVPWPNPQDDVLYRPVLPEHYKALAIPEGVTGTIVVEASSWLEDNQWILDLAADDPFIVGFVGNLSLTSPDFADSLARFAANPLFRGIRAGRNVLDPANEEHTLARMNLLLAHTLTLDLLVGPDALPRIAWLAESLPDLHIVVNHVAGVAIDGNPPDSQWVEGIHELTAHPNVYCKVSGLVEGTRSQPAPRNVDYYAPTLDVLWDALGKDRLIYASNWPVSERFADYVTVQQIAVDYFREKGETALEKCLWRNSQKAYRWVER